MLKDIFINIRSDNSVFVQNNYKIMQGSINEYRLVIDPSAIALNRQNAVGYISFKRPDNRLSGEVPLTKITNSRYEYIIKDLWILNNAGTLYATLSFRTAENGVQTELFVPCNVPLAVYPLANYDLDVNTAPDTTTALVNLINKKVDKDFSEYEELPWSEITDNEYVVINDTEGNVKRVELKNLYNTVNEIKPDENGNIELLSDDIPYDNTKTKSVKDLIDTGLYYSDAGLVIPDTVINVYSAEYANQSVSATKDSVGNIISDYYQPKSKVKTIPELQLLYSGDLGASNITTSVHIPENTIVVLLDTNSGMTSIGVYDSQKGQFEFNYETMSKDSNTVEVDKFKYKLKQEQGVDNRYTGTLEYLALEGQIESNLTITRYTTNAHRNGNIYIIKIKEV